MNYLIYIGFDPREQDAYLVCEHSLRARASTPVRIKSLRLDDLRRQGLYQRPTEIRDGRLWDAISDAPMSTEFAISRFFLPILAKIAEENAKWAVFCDCDFLWLDDINKLIKDCDPSKAVVCVQHQYTPTESLKMDGQLQLVYQRKNWSSMMAFNLHHPSNAKLDITLLNTLPGRDLHRFCWLRDDEIGSVSTRWNWLEGTYEANGDLPGAVHFTRGGPWMEGWEDVDYGDLWTQALMEVRSKEGRDP